MNSYLRYIEDESFLEWVLNPTEEISKYWEAYVKKNPQEKEVIYFLKDFLLVLKTKDLKLSKPDREEILLRIEQKLDEAKKPLNLYKFIKQSTKYAAILGIVVITSLYFFSRRVKDQAAFQGTPKVSLDTISETQLILGSGEQVVVRNNSSTVVYSGSGAVVVNESDTLDRSARKETIIETLNQLIVPYGKRSKITLSDGSTVHLNSGSKLTFPEEFIGTRRQVYLDGEAFFEIETNKSKPFVVKSMNSNMDIKAIGTEFNVSAYSSDKQVTTVLITGEVHIETTNNNATLARTIMKPSELASWNKKNEAVKIKKVDTYPFISWMDGILKVNSEPLESVVKKIERFYNVRINIEDSLKKHIKISGKLDLNNEIDKTLENIVATTAINYKKINTKEYEIIQK